MLRQFPVAVQVKSLHNKAGLYLHVPFCRKKCAYCDFYSSFASDTLIDEYTAALIKELKKWGGCFGRPIDTIYLGGGTPSLLGKRVTAVIAAVRESFEVDENAESVALTASYFSNGKNITTPVAFYDSGKNYISGCQIPQTGAVGADDFVVDIPSDAKYVRFCWTTEKTTHVTTGKAI